MSRQLTNVSGETRAVQDAAGRWHVVEPDAVLTVDDADQRYYQTGEQGEPAIWAETRPTKTRNSKQSNEEAS